MERLKKKTTIEKLGESEKTTLYSISFEMDDSVHALPIESGKLRLYCLRLSEQIVILGNGGVKTTSTYEEDPRLFGYVIDLQRFEAMLMENLKKGYVSIRERELTGIEDMTFEI